MKYVCGFTLIEMMVALSIGVMIAFLAGQLYVLSISTAMSQERAAQQINIPSFVLPNIVSNVRLAGLGIDGAVLNNPNPIGVLIDGTQLLGKSVPYNIERYLTSTFKMNDTDRTNIPSEQLTIIYRAPQDMWDCEGNIALGPRRARLENGKMVRVDGQVVIERYFVQADHGIMNLRCDAAHFIPENIRRDSTRDRKFSQSSSSFLNAIIDAKAKITKKANVIYGLGGQGEIIASHVEGLWIQLGVKMSDGVRLMTIDDYQKLGSRKPIVMINLALLGRSSVPLPQNQVSEHSFDVFGKILQLPKHTPNYHRQPYQVGVTLRNTANELDVP